MSDERFDRAKLLALAAAAGAAAALPGGATADVLAAFPRPHARWRFVFVNHATTNPFFVPARNGIADACALLGVTAAWTGSKTSNVGEMVRAMQAAIHEGADGIAVSLIAPTAFDGTIARATKKGIPIVTYNAGTQASSLAYVGQDLYESGLRMGARIVELVGHGDVALFIATPGQQNIQPRIDGALDAIKDSGAPVRATVVATGASVPGERKRIDATVHATPGLRGLFAVDGGSTQGVAQVMRAHGLHRKGVRAGGYDLLPDTLAAIHDGVVDFTIDQQPYLQGFLPVLQLFLARYSGGLVAPVDTNTGLLFVTRANVGPYLARHSRFEGRP